MEVIFLGGDFDLDLGVRLSGNNYVWFIGGAFV